METVNTLIQFTTKAVTGGGTVNQQLLGLLNTGNFASLALLLSAFFIFICAIIFVVPYFTKQTDFTMNSAFARLSKTKMSFVVTSLFVLAGFSYGGFIYTNFALAEQNSNYVTAPDTISAYVDQNYSVSFDKSYLKQSGNTEILLSGLSVKYCDGISVDENIQWNVKVDNNQVYNDVAGKSVTDLKIPVKDSSVVFEAQGISKNSLSAFIGKKVLNVGFTVDKKLNEAQEKAINTANKIGTDAVNKILDPSMFPVKNLFIEDKEVFINEINEATKDAKAKIEQTTDEAEIAKILSELDETINQIISRAEEKMNSTIEDKNNYISSKTSSIEDAIAQVESNEWLSSVQKEILITKLQKILEQIEPVIDGTESADAYTEAKLWIDSSIQGVQNEINVQITEKSDAFAEIQSEIDANIIKIEAIQNLSESKKNEFIEELNSFIDDAKASIIAAYDSVEIAVIIERYKSIIESEYTNALNLVRPWDLEFELNMTSYIIPAGESLRLDGKANIDSDERKDSALKTDPWYSIELVSTFNDGGFNVTKDADGYPVVSVDASTEIGDYNATVTATYNSVVDAGSVASKSVNIIISVDYSGSTSAKAICYTDSKGEDGLMEFVYDAKNYDIGTTTEKGTISATYHVTYTYFNLEDEENMIFPEWISYSPESEEEFPQVFFHPKHINFDTSFKNFKTYDEFSGVHEGEPFSRLDLFFMGMNTDSRFSSNGSENWVTGFENIAENQIESIAGMFFETFINFGSEDEEYIIFDNNYVIDLTNFHQDNLSNCFAAFLECAINKLIIPGNFAPKLTRFYPEGSTEESIFEKEPHTPFFLCFSKEIEFVPFVDGDTTYKYGCNVVDGTGFFDQCMFLQKVNLDGLDLSNNENFTGMFNECKSIRNIDLSLLDTSKSKSYKEMFFGCQLLSSIDISDLNFTNVLNVSDMFSWCVNLERVYCKNDTLISKIASKEKDIFSNCSDLIGGNGTKYKYEPESHFAIIDKATKDSEIKGCLTYKNDDACKITYDLNGGQSGEDDYSNYFQQVKQNDYFTVQGATPLTDPVNSSGLSFTGWSVEGDSTLYKANDKIMATGSSMKLIAQWGESNATAKAVCYLDSNGEDTLMEFVYDDNDYPEGTEIAGKGKIKYVFKIRYSHFNLDEWMQGIKPIYPSWFDENTSQSLFSAQQIVFAPSFKQFKYYDDPDDTAYYGKSFNSLDAWFAGMINLNKVEGLENICSQIESINGLFMASGTMGSSMDIDFSNVSWPNLKSLQWTFQSFTCRKIILPDNFAPLANNIGRSPGDTKEGSISPFYDCNSQTIQCKGSIGNTKNDSENLDNLFAYCNAQEFILDNKLISHAISANHMFTNTHKVTSIDLSSWSSNKLEDVKSMFENSSSLEYINFSNFDTSNIKDCSRMFFECTKLSTIYVGDNWKLDSSVESVNMFSGCDKLCGQMGSTIINVTELPRSNYVDQQHNLDAYMAKIDNWNDVMPAKDSCGYLSRYEQAVAQPLVAVSDIIIGFFNPILQLLMFKA